MNTKITKISRTTSVAKLLAFLLIFTVLAVSSRPTNAAINEQINYQGRLLTSTGAVVADGDYNMRFKVYEGGDGCVGGGSSPCSGTLVWTEEWKQSNRVRVANGYFSVYLGSLEAFGNSVDWNESSLWLSIDIGGTANTASPTYDGEMLPFRRFGAVPQAFQAANSTLLNGLQSTAFVQLAQGVQNDASTTNASIFINKTGGTADIINLQRAGTSVLLIGNGGSASFKTTTDSTTGFQISDADGGTPIFNVDTANERVGIKTNAPTADLQVDGQVVIGDGEPVFHSTVPGAIALSVINNNGAARQGFESYSSNATDGGAFFAIRGRGDQSSPSESLDGDLLFQLGASGMTTSGMPAALLGNASTVGFIQDADATSTTAPAAITLNTQNTERIRITSGGNVGVGDSSPASLFTVGTADAFQINASGQVIAGTWQGSTVALDYGGTGATTAQGAINNISGLTTNGDLLYHNGSNSTRLARGSNGDCLTSTSTTIQWGSCGSGANTALSNLASTAINTDLTFAHNSSRTIGMTTPTSGAAGDIIIKAADACTFCGNGGDIYLTTGLNSGSMSTTGNVYVNSGAGEFGTGLIVGHDGATTTDTFFAVGTKTPQARAHISAASGTLFRITDTTSTSRNVVDVADGGATTLRNQTNSTGAFTIQNAAGTALFTADTTNTLLRVGVSDANTTQFVLDTDSDTTEATGVEGGMYYNSAIGQFRCYGGSIASFWKNCGNSVSPSSGEFFIRDDFINSGPSSGTVGTEGWTTNTNGTGSSVASDGTFVTADRPGNVTFDTGTTNSGVAGIGLGTGGSNSQLLVGANLEIEFAAKLNSISSPSVQSYVFRAGLMTGTGANANTPNSVYFEFDSASSANWKIFSYNNSAFTTTTTSVAATTNWTRFKIVVNSSASSISFYIDGSLAGTINSNIPTASGRNVAPAVVLNKTAGTTSRSVVLDYYYLRGGTAAMR